MKKELKDFWFSKEFMEKERQREIAMNKYYSENINCSNCEVENEVKIGETKDCFYCGTKISR